MGLSIKFPHRCNQCRRRFTLRRKHTQYYRRRRCPHRGAYNIYFDNYTYHERLTRRVCRCDGLPFPHRPACSVWCVKHPTGPTDHDHVHAYEFGVPGYNRQGY